MSFSFNKTFAISITVACALGLGGAEAQPPAAIETLTPALAKEYGLDQAFYKKTCNADSILVACSGDVPEIAIWETASLFRRIMKSIDQKVADRVREKKVLCILVGHKELTSDVPQFKTNKQGKDLDFYNWRQRGFLTRIAGRPVVLFAEEDVLEYDGGMQLESILIHEFGHVIHNAGFSEAQQKQLTDAFQRARAKGIWIDGRAAQRFRRVKSETPVRLFDALVEWFPNRRPAMLRKYLDRGDIVVNGQRVNADARVTSEDKVLIVFGGEKECYAHKNRAEYWAEGVQCWYNTNRTMDHDHNHIHTREQLKAYDPALAALCEQVLTNDPWRFVSPRKRAGQGHLKGFDPADSPVVVDKPHIQTAAYDYYDKYWASYWSRLEDKHSLAKELKSESIEKLAEDAARTGDAIRGAIHFSQQRLACLKCHGDVKRGLLGPDLRRLDKKLPLTHIVESLLEPSKKIEKAYGLWRIRLDDGKVLTGRIVSESDEQLILRLDDAEQSKRTISLEDVERREPSETSAMPARLMDQLDSRQDFLDLVRYLDALRNSGTSNAAVEQSPRELSPAIRGIAWLDVYQCGQCHVLPNAAGNQSVQRGVNLRWSAGRIDPDYLYRFIRDPSQVKPGATMPHMLDQVSENDRAQVATELTHYLLSLADRKFGKAGELDAQAVERGNVLFHEIGCVACHGPRDEPTIRKDAKRDWVPLFAGKFAKSALIDFLKQPHLARPSGRMPQLNLSHWEAVDLASYLLRDAARDAARVEEDRSQAWKLNKGLAAKGRERFQSLRCQACHDVGANEEDRAVVTKKLPLPTTRTSETGCLSANSGAWPRFDFPRESVRDDLLAALRQQEEVGPRDRIDAAMATLRCNACHQRDGWGGFPEEMQGYLHTTDENLGPQGRMPPSLSKIGAKLNEQWLRDVLISGRTARPYVKTRMPRFAESRVALLPALLKEVDKPAEREYPVVEGRDVLKETRNRGHELAGRSGLNCIACHTFQEKRAATMSAIDLTLMHERLEKSWFHQYMRTPQQFNARTVMPSFWPGGRAIRPRILDGDVDLQIEALWLYLKDGRQARAPQGLIRKPLRLLATNEAVMLRRSYPNIGKRGIGVGYPLQLNLAFDAEQLRLATLWAGEFADPSGVFRSQGHGVVRPLARDVIQFAKGPDFYDAAAPWKPEDDRPAEHRFLGYELDAKRRPAFLYQYGSVRVSDFVEDLRHADRTPYLQRTVRLTTQKSKANSLVFRVASGKQIERVGDAFKIDGKLRVQASGRAEVVDRLGMKELRVKAFPEPSATQTIKITYWIP